MTIYQEMVENYEYINVSTRFQRITKYLKLEGMHKNW